MGQLKVRSSDCPIKHLAIVVLKGFDSLRYQWEDITQGYVLQWSMAEGDNDRNNTPRLLSTQ